MFNILEPWQKVIKIDEDELVIEDIRKFNDPVLVSCASFITMQDDETGHLRGVLVDIVMCA